jgi:hypothetical protein
MKQESHSETGKVAKKRSHQKVAEPRMFFKETQKKNVFYPVTVVANIFIFKAVLDLFYGESRKKTGRLSRRKNFFNAVQISRGEKTC